MRQQFGDSAVALSRQARQDILEVGIRVVPVELGGSNQTHDCRGSLARSQRSSEQPVRAADCPGTDLVFDPVVIDRNAAIAEVARQRYPALQAVIDRFHDGGALRHSRFLTDQPGVQRVRGRLTSLLTHCVTLLWRHLRSFPFNVVQGAEEFQRLLGKRPRKASCIV